MPSTRKSPVKKKSPRKPSRRKRPLTPAELAARRANAARSTGPRTGPGKRRSAANALRSTGPRTPQGKQNSARNAFRHGLASQAFLLPSEEPAEFDDHRRNLERDFRPVGDDETRLVHLLARLHWKLRRVHHVHRKLGDVHHIKFLPEAHCLRTGSSSPRPPRPPR